jgi:outer membrane protein assembly factor BamB
VDSRRTRLFFLRLTVTFVVSAVATVVGQSDTIWRAARDGNIAQLRSAIAAGTQVDVKDPAGATPLFYASQQGHLEIVEFLAARGADLNAVAPLTIGGQSYRVSALAAAALGWHVDVARFLLARVTPRPKYLVVHHELMPFSQEEFDSQRDWEVINTVLRTPEVEPITRAIVEREGSGTYRTHDGREYRAERLQNGSVRFTGRDGSVSSFEYVGGKAFMQRLPADARGSGPVRNRNERELTMIRRFLEPMSNAAARDTLIEQFLERGGTWLDFTVGEGRVLGFEIREGGPARLGGTPTIFVKDGARPATSPLLEREIASAATVVARPMNWPSFRGPGASGVADGQAPPVTWDAEQSRNIRWKTKIEGLGHASPIVWGDRVFVTTAISSRTDPEFRPGGVRGDNTSDDRTEQTWKLLSLDKTTGQIVWERTIYKGQPRLGRHLKSTFATATPATDGQRIVVSLGPEGLYSYDVNGNLLWKKDLGIVGHSSYGFGSSPTIYRDVVIVQCDTNLGGKPSATGPASFIAAFDLTTGAERWRTPRDEDSSSSFGTPVIYEADSRSMVIANGGKRARAYDPATGKEIWSLAAPASIVTPTPVIGHGLIFVMSGDTGYQPIFAIRPSARGDITLKTDQETSDFVVWSTTRGGSFTPTPIVYGDYLYSINVSGIVGCYDARTGERKYLGRLEHLGDGFSSSPVAADGRIYFASEDGDVFVVKAGPTFEVIARNPMGEVILTTPAISGGTIFIRTLHHLVAAGR